MIFRRAFVALHRADRSLLAADADAVNTFEQPDLVAPAKSRDTSLVRDGAFERVLPANAYEVLRVRAP